MTNIILEKMKWSHMFSYGANNEVDFTKNRITQLSGVNGNGKSAINLILQEILFSKNIKGIKKGDIIHRYSGAKAWTGELSFKKGDKNYLVSVKRQGDTSKVSLSENGIDISEHKIPDTYKKIQSILEMDFDVFSQLTYQSSNNLLEFINATDTNRKKFLINLFKLTQYLEIGEKIKALGVEIEKNYLQLQGELRGVETFLAENEIKNKLTEVSVPIVDDTLGPEIQELANQLKEYNSLCEKIDRNNILLEEKRNIVLNLNIDEPSEDKISAISTRLAELTNVISSNSTVKSSISKQIASLDLSDHCYACKQPIDNSTNQKLKEQLETELTTIAINLEEAQRQHKELILESISLQSQLTKYKENQRKIERFEQLSQLIDTSLPTTYPDFAKINEDFKQKTQILKKQREEYEEAIRQNEKIKIFNAKIDGLRDQRRSFLARQELLNNDIIAHKSRIDRLNILKKAFSTSGMVAFKLENLTKEFETTINTYLAELSDGQFQLVFRLEGEKLNIIVVSHGKESPIENASAGEFSRIQTAILLAIRNLLSKMGGNSINLLFLDEITGTLDKSGKERLIDILLEENLNVFLISHDFEHPLIPKISVLKDNNVSYLET